MGRSGREDDPLAIEEVGEGAVDLALSGLRQHNAHAPPVLRVALAAHEAHAEAFGALDAERSQRATWAAQQDAKIEPLPRPVRGKAGKLALRLKGPEPSWR